MKTAREIHNGNKNRLNLPLHKLFGWSVRLILSGFCWSLYGGVVYRSVARKRTDNGRDPLRMGLSGFHSFLCCRSRDYHLVINTLIHTVMTMDITKSVAFTGHRSERILQVRMLYLYLDIVSQMKRLYSLGYRYFLSGMAEGFDLLAAQAVADLKMEYTDIRLIAVVPFRRQSDRYRPENKSLYDRIMKTADETVILREDYCKGCFHHRNDYLIDNSEIVLAYWDKQPYGGTYYTVGKARMMNRNIINLYK